MKLPTTQKCPDCDKIILHCGGDSPFYYCKECCIHYHINLFITDNEWREMLGLPINQLSTKEKKESLEEWLK